MSLTSELKNRSSPVSELVCFIGALVAETRRGNPLADQAKGLLGIDGAAVPTVVPPVAGASGPTVGTSFDHRLRYIFGPVRSDDLVAWQGAAHLARVDPATRGQVLRFFGNLDALVSRLNPAGATLDDDDERLLDTYCVVLAKFEAIYRSGGMWLPPDFPLEDAPSERPEDDPVLALAAEPDVLDVVNLSRSAARELDLLVHPVVDGRLGYHANPAFAGSGDIGGADADFIIGDTIFELKTTKSFVPSAIGDALLQLIGYTLLDYDDRYSIRRVGLYFSRQAWLATWPLWTMVFPFAEVVQRTRNQSEPTEEEIIARLDKLRRLMRRAVAHERIDFAAEFSMSNSS